MIEYICNQICNHLLLLHKLSISLHFFFHPVCFFVVRFMVRFCFLSACKCTSVSSEWILYIFFFLSLCVVCMSCVYSKLVKMFLCTHLSQITPNNNRLCVAGVSLLYIGRNYRWNETIIFFFRQQRKLCLIAFSHAHLHVIPFTSSFCLSFNVWWVILGRYPLDMYIFSNWNCHQSISIQFFFIVSP